MSQEKSNNTVRGILIFIVTMLLLSGSLRLGTVGIAFASVASENDATLSKSPHAVCTTDAETELLMTMLQERSEKLAKQEELQAERQTKLVQAEAKILANLSRVEEAERKLSQTIAQVGEASSNDINQLTSVYQSMKSKDAAALFEQMSPEFAAGFLSGMSPAAAAGILSGLSSEKAYAVSVVLAGRNADAPTQ